MGKRRGIAAYIEENNSSHSSAFANSFPSGSLELGSEQARVNATLSLQYCLLVVECEFETCLVSWSLSCLKTVSAADVLESRTGQV